jgi:hypothetical protein
MNGASQQWGYKKRMPVPKVTLSEAQFLLHFKERA